MKSTFIFFLLLHCIALVVMDEEPNSKDLDLDGKDNEDLERKHRKKKKQQNHGPCGYGGYGRSFGDKFFGSPSHPDYTYVNAPVMNYFFGCGVAALPVAPIAPIAPVAAYPVQIGLNQHGHGGHGHGGHGHGHGHGGHGGQSSHGGYVGYGGQGGHFGGGNIGYNQQFQSPYNQGYSAPLNRPFQNVVSAAASGFGTALADYITRPRKQYKQVNKQVNRYLKPLYKLF